MTSSNPPIETRVRPRTSPRAAAATATAFLIVLTLAGGCQTTGFARSQAANLGSQLAQYRQQQSDRVDRFNQEYRERFNQLMDELVRLADTELQQGRDADAQSMADDLISDDKQSLIGHLRKTFADHMRQQRDAIANADDAITATRAAYVQAYTDAALDLAKIDKVRKDLELLATKESIGTVLNNASHVIQNVIQTREELKKAAASDTSGGKGAGGS